MGVDGAGLDELVELTEADAGEAADVGDEVSAPRQVAVDQTGLVDGVEPCEELVEGCRLAIGVDEDEAVPRVD